MIDAIIQKLENEGRIKELNPKETLIVAGLREGNIVCDLGAGTGLFTFAAAELTSKTIFSLDISDEIITYLYERKKDLGADNVEIRKVDSNILPLENESCDFFITSAVLHEIEDLSKMFIEIIRTLKENGRILIIDFHKRNTPSGPPFERRVSSDYVEEIARSVKFDLIEKGSLGDNFYFLLLRKQRSKFINTSQNLVC